MAISECWPAGSPARARVRSNTTAMTAAFAALRPSTRERSSKGPPSVCTYAAAEGHGVPLLVAERVAVREAIAPYWRGPSDAGP